MTEERSYTTEEIAKLLKISKLTVYDLIKKGDLPAYRVGRQMRVDASDLERYKRQAKAGGTSMPPSSLPPDRSGEGQRQLVITGQDVSLDILARHIEKQTGAYRALRSQAGSLDSLIAMYQGQADIVSTHLLDGDTGAYNVPYIRRILSGFSYVVVNLVSRPAGLYVQPGNPRRIRGWMDLQRDDVRIVNREKGAGARVLLDEQLRLHGISPSRVTGYDDEVSGHLSVAGAVVSGAADAGVGIEKAAAAVGAQFIPLIQERYDLVMLKTGANRAWIESVLAILKSEQLRRELASIQGYDLSMTGQIVYET
ncbi:MULTISPECIES: helix-turn-helix transcriptional regulator [unclassified Paenibacillus]|uniref:helix-turn-helix transcriptional regulator n=1 Tax=unclassified Paenibacillus TaxID=185978 RepID=UPI0009302C67|nr:MULTISPECIES: helix-turn-helix transcriptional regulator [unclassified Paenibacillus]